MKNIQELPTEILLLIFENLDASSLVRASGVSRQWFELSRDGLVWKRMCEKKWTPKTLVFEPERGDEKAWRKIFFYEKLCRKASLLGLRAFSFLGWKNK